MNKTIKFIFVLKSQISKYKIQKSTFKGIHKLLSFPLQPTTDKHSVKYTPGMYNCIRQVCIIVYPRYVYIDSPSVARGLRYFSTQES